MKSCGCTRARIFGVNDGNPTNTHLVKHDLATNAFLSGDETSHGVANGHSLQYILIHTRSVEGNFDRLTSEIFHSPVHVFTKTGHACANNCNLSHFGDPPQVVWNSVHDKPHSPLLRKANSATMKASKGNLNELCRAYLCSLFDFAAR